MVVSKANREASRLSFAPDNQRHLQRGIATLERTLGLTLGPGGRSVVIERVGRPNQPPELLDDGSTIARRITGLPDRFANMGFMLARHAAWKMRTEVHDGAATAVVILAAAHRELQTQIAAGANRVDLKCQVEAALATAIEMIATEAQPLDPTDIASFVATMSTHDEIARVIPEALALLGPEATIVTRASRGRRIELECIEGALWESTGIIAPLAAGRDRHRLARPRVLLWDGPIDEVRSLATALNLLRMDGARAVLIIAQSFTPDVLGLLTINSAPEFELAPVIAPHEGRQQDWAFQDLAALTGSRRLSPVANDALARLNPDAVATVSRATIGPRFLNILTNDEQSPSAQRNLAAVRHLMSATEDEKVWQHLQLRLGRLQQGMGVIWVGAATETERDALLQSAERTLHSLRAALTAGVVPGAGAMLLAVSRRLVTHHNQGALVVARALEAPARWIARNAGVDPNTVVARIGASAPARGFDGVRREIVDLRSSGIVDPVTTVVEAVRIGLSTAVIASDSGVLVHRPIALHQAEIRP